MKGLWKPWNDESFYWKILKVNMTCEWLGEFYENWWLGSDAIPFQFESTPTIPNMGKGLTRNLCALVWVPSKQASSGLGWKLPLQQKKWCDMTWMRWMSGPSPVQFPGWQSVFTGRPSSWGEVPILEYVSERLWLVVRIRSMINQGQLTLTDYCKCCGTSVRPLQSVELFE
jgi:hypothetical protein